MKISFYIADIMYIIYIMYISIFLEISRGSPYAAYALNLDEELPRQEPSFLSLVYSKYLL